MEKTVEEIKALLVGQSIPAFGIAESMLMENEARNYGCSDTLASGKVDRLACVKHSMKTPIFSYLMKTKAFDPSEAPLINHLTGVDDHSMYTCINCVSKCPYC